MKWNRPADRSTRMFGPLFNVATYFMLVVASAGCRVAAPIHVWHPSQCSVPNRSTVAVALLGEGDGIIARLESAMLAERPQARADLIIASTPQLVQRLPIQLVSTNWQQSNLTALEAARQSNFGLLIEGVVLSSRLKEPRVQPEATEIGLYQNANRSKKETGPPDYLLLSWRLVEVSTGKGLASHIVSIDSRVADERYPELAAVQQDETERLVVASARESWKIIAPAVEVERVELMVPWLQLGAMRTRAGIVDANKNRWDLAEQRWRTASRWNPLNVAARHNLALAAAAREDFAEAKRQLKSVPWPLSTRLPPETYFWLDQKHRQYVAAHGLDKPAEGWAFPDPEPEPELTDARPIEVETLPWWTAIPFTKPPHWTWQGWLRQPIVL